MVMVVRLLYLAAASAPSPPARMFVRIVARVSGLLVEVPDPRTRRGIRHTMSALLAVASAAVLSGTRFTAIGEWTCQTRRSTCSQLCVRRNGRTGGHVAPYGATVASTADRGRRVDHAI